MKQIYLCGAVSNNPNYKQDFETAYNKPQKASYSKADGLIRKQSKLYIPTIYFAT